MNTHQPEEKKCEHGSWIGNGCPEGCHVSSPEVPKYIDNIWAEYSNGDGNMDQIGFKDAVKKVQNSTLEEIVLAIENSQDGCATFPTLIRSLKQEK